MRKADGKSEVGVLVTEHRTPASYDRPTVIPLSSNDRPTIVPLSSNRKVDNTAKKFPLRGQPMFVEYIVPECDFTHNKYSPAVDGAAVLARGATGRWCAVLFVGPEYLEENNIIPLTYNDAVQQCRKQGGYIDF